MPSRDLAVRRRKSVEVERIAMRIRSPGDLAHPVRPATSAAIELDLGGFYYPPLTDRTWPVIQEA